MCEHLNTNIFAIGKNDPMNIHIDLSITLYDYLLMYIFKLPSGTIRFYLKTPLQYFL